jgi:DNA-binding transcriptional LysR family regulator
MLDLRRVRVFFEVAERRSFSAAASALDYTQSSVSHHVLALERELGQ